MSELVIIAIDIEARGQGPVTHGIISIGVCVGNSSREEVIEKRRFDLLPLPGQVIEKRCFDEFWSKQPALFSTLTCDAKDAIAQMEEFRRFIDRFPNAYIVCDNPGFDFGMINYYLDLCGHYTLNHTAKLEYRNTHDADSYGRGFLHSNFDNPWLSNASLIEKLGSSLDVTLHNHLPENDAELVYRLHYQTVTNQNHVIL